MEDIFTFIVSIFLLIVPFIDWTAAILLYKAHKVYPDGIAIRERAVVAGILAVASSLVAILAILRLLSVVVPTLSVIILSISLILTSFPSAYWLWLYSNNKLR